MSGAQKQRLNEILWWVWFDEKIRLEEVVYTKAQNIYWSS